MRLTTRLATPIVALISSLFLLISCSESGKTVDQASETIPLREILEDEDGRLYKHFQYEGETFKIFEPDNNKIIVEGLDMTGTVSFSEKTNQYTGAVLLMEVHFDTPTGALEYVCNRMIKRSRQPDQEELTKGLHQFFETLEQER